MVALAACAPSPEAIAKASFSAEEIDVPLELFSKACLQTLPSLEQTEQVVKTQGLVLQQQSDGIKLFAAEEGKRAAIAIGEHAGKPVCGVAFIGPRDTKTTGQKFLAEAQKRTGGKFKEQFPSSHFQYAVHLKNSSLMTQDSRAKPGRMSYVFLVSSPVKRSEVDALIYN
ncbi:MAG: hypothetical protein ABJQ70_08170 [Roseobacter sp.]